VIGVEVTHIPYRGAAPTMQDLIAGRIDYQCPNTTVALPQIEAGTIKPIAILTRARSPILPDLASAYEQGLTELEASIWYAFFLPKGTPDAVVAQAPRRHGRHHGDVLRAGAPQGHRRDRGGARAPLAGIFAEIRRERDREMGGADQGGEHHGGVRRWRCACRLRAGRLARIGLLFDSTCFRRTPGRGGIVGSAVP
jgi:hypothetical protein